VAEIARKEHPDGIRKLKMLFEKKKMHSRPCCRKKDIKQYIWPLIRDMVLPVIPFKNSNNLMYLAA